MNTIIGTNKDNKKQKKIGILTIAHHFASNRCIGAGRVLFYLAAKEELVKWLNDLYQTEIAITVAVIKMQIVTIFLTTCASKYPNTTNLVYFDMAGSYMINTKSAKTVQIITTSNDKNWVICVLAIIASDQFLNKQPGVSRTNKSLSLLVMDSFEGYKIQIVYQKYHINNIYKAIISESLMSIVQPLDCILKTWNDILVAMIIKLFKKYSISNKLDSTENDLLYDSDTEYNEVDDNKNLIKVVNKYSLFAEELGLED
ncbi:41822_t:CDS:2 [Gigaspora margarita]|uniref:41822_t:CDS:1 n=1 Tax=Gigaspora margarita TaxID=4874 RepID=A0ABN7VG34_GIGMA|nr:41822_t:CDS:2 [Gigaspora margarita]